MNLKTRKLKKYSDNECYYFESSSSRLMINTVNPNDTVENNRCRPTKAKAKKRNNIDFNYSFKPPYTRTSNSLIHELMQDYAFNSNVYINDRNSDDDTNMATNGHSDKRSCNGQFHISDYPTSCSRSLPKTSFRKRRQTKQYNQNNKQRQFSTNDRCAEPIYNEIERQAEETTHLRPQNNVYNKEFVYKSMQRNLRLQNIIKQLVVERQREKQKESWNNYIDELKTKHGYNKNNSTRQSQCLNTSDYIGDYYNTKHSWLQSDPTQTLLNDFYKICSDVQSNSNDHSTHDYDNTLYQNGARCYESNKYCYPTSSQGRFTMQNNGIIPKHLKKYFQGNPNIIGICQSNKKKRCSNINSSGNAHDALDTKKGIVKQTISSGTQTIILPDLNVNNLDVVAKKFSQESPSKEICTKKSLTEANSKIKSVTKETSVQRIPIKKTSVQIIPIKKTSEQAIPVKKTDVQTIPIQKTSIQTIPIKETSVKAIPIKKSSSSSQRKVLNKGTSLSSQNFSSKLLQNPERNIAELKHECEILQNSDEEILQSNVLNASEDTTIKSLQNIENIEEELKEDNSGSARLQNLDNNKATMMGVHKSSCACERLQYIESTVAKLKIIDGTCKRSQNKDSNEPMLKKEINSFRERLQKVNNNLAELNKKECTCKSSKSIDSNVARQEGVGCAYCFCKPLQTIDCSATILNKRECLCRHRQNTESSNGAMNKANSVCKQISKNFDTNADSLREANCSYERLQNKYRNAARQNEVDCGCCSCKLLQNIDDNVVKLSKVDCTCKRMQNINNVATPAKVECSCCSCNQTRLAELDCYCKRLKNEDRNRRTQNQVQCTCNILQNLDKNGSLNKVECGCKRMQDIEPNLNKVECTCKYFKNKDSNKVKLKEVECACKRMQDSECGAAKLEVECACRHSNNINSNLGKLNEIDCVCKHLQNIDCVCDPMRDIESTVVKAMEQTTVKPLQNIEYKLDILIESLNSFLKEMRTTECYKGKAKSISIISVSDEMDTPPKSMDSRIQKTDQVLFTTVLRGTPKNNVISENTTNTPRPHRNCNTQQIENIIQEEMEKSKKIKSDIKELLHTRCDRDCTVEISFDIPTKEVSTAVTASLSQTQHRSGKEYDNEQINDSARSEGRADRQMTIAVNTDPLGLLALLRISADAVKQLLSYMPQLNYNLYLRALQPPQQSDFAPHMCNICGAAFCRPSQLSDHIQQNHDLRRTRDCCVCRHVRNMQNEPIAMFKCKYCKKRFIRAYCCELHQQACAKQSGRQHDVAPNLMFLR